MDHISTLCALSTVGIATTGLALGRVERTKSSLLRRKTLPHNQVSPHPTEAPNKVRPQTSRSLRPKSAGTSWILREKPTDNRGSQDPQSHGPDLRKASLSFGAARMRRRGQTLTNPPLRIPENETTDPPPSRRPSTGWLRRLSTVSFQTESPSTNSPVTPSFNGSASPILPRPASRRSPNKLVKRTSQHSNVPLYVNTAESPNPGLRRPATSYQQSESRPFQSPLVTNFESEISERFLLDSPGFDEFGLHSQDEWKPYLSPKSTGFSEKLARKLPAAGTPMGSGVRRITSDRDTLPALVLATTIKAPNPQIQTEPPFTPVEFRNPFQNNGTDQLTPLPTPPPEKSRHKHSYSMSDAESKRIIVNTVTGSGDPILGRPRGGSLKRVKGRTFSIPRTELAKLEKATPGVSAPPPQRRNITDPSIFRQPQGVSPSGLPISSVGRDAQVGPRSVSQDYNIGLRRNRPLTSDAVALSTWQHSCRPSGPESNVYNTSLRRRPKRFSIAASDPSDPSSTVIGSDDTRVFTSSDEYETDMMTEYWDSIRTRRTSASGLKGLRIETMFDKAGANLSNEEVTTLAELLPHGSFASRIERDPPLFSGSLLPVAPLHLNLSDIAALPVAEDESQSSIGALTEDFDPPSQKHRTTDFSPSQKHPLSDYPPSQNRSLSEFHPSHSISHKNPLSESLSNPFKMNHSDDIDSRLSLDLSDPGSPIDDLRSLRSLREDSTVKMNIFDWSEQRESESEARPRTVHGKQQDINRGSRAACRKVPSAVHLRSQSVPVVGDATTTDSRQTSGKFGTWALGTKGVSEDWDSDFDFEDDENEAPPSQDTKTTDSECLSQTVAVPQAILERQASLRGQFGQVQELTLLVEELKRLRHQAGLLSLLDGPATELWKEAEGIINLATIDDDEHHHHRSSPPGSPSSLTFSFDDSDDEGNPTKKFNDGQKSDGLDALAHDTQKCTSALEQLSMHSPKSKSVLEFLHPSQRTESSTLPRVSHHARPQKLPFDTSSLRDLVVRAGVVTRALKEVIRKAEGVDAKPQDIVPSDPPFRRIFDQPSQDDLASFEAAMAEMH
ncbi:hypothetical protein N7493_007102 [Penicillium malachiteum]|uniref:Uncharacterized protein n=1 Tax=Penicillium malachiteum TaxID=1324776 RepID=A0AAD6HIX3_9EURO|nr:hypothetical protein N7493_007102 [Penicillium malachiteum]